MNRKPYITISQRRKFRHDLYGSLLLLAGCGFVVAFFYSQVR